MEAANDRDVTARSTPAWYLAEKYACNGPRYTSYPTAPHFSEEFPQEEYTAWLHEAVERQRAPLSLYVHLPFCRDICYYCACNKVVTRKPGTAREYLDHLAREIAEQASIVGRQRPITQLHWGGGTPTYLDAAEITELMHLLASHFNLLDRSYREYTVEIDPRTVEPETIALLKGVGFNRLSLGVQDFDPLVQSACNRSQPYKLVAQLVESIRAHGFRSLSFDLLYGLPHQDRTSMAQTLEKVVRLQPDRVACYNYAHLPERFSSQRAIDRINLPQAAEKLALAELISDTLQASGYLHIGMDHYVLPGDELATAQAENRLQRNFQGYSVHMADDLLGLGVSAISQMGDYYVQNERDLGAYYQRTREGQLPIARGCKLSDEDRLRRHVIMQLSCNLHLDPGEVSREFGIDFASHFSTALSALEPMARDGLVALDPAEIRVTPLGRAFLRNICMLFDAYLERTGAAGTVRHSALFNHPNSKERKPTMFFNSYYGSRRSRIANRVGPMPVTANYNSITAARHLAYNSGNWQQWNHR